MNQISKEAILENIEREHNLLMQTLGELSQTQMVQPGMIPTPAPGQSCKDIVAHLTAWEQRMLHIIRAILAGDSLPQYAPSRKFNEQVFQHNKDHTLEEVLANFDRSYHESLAFVQQLTDAEVAVAEVSMLIGYNRYNHYKWARTTIRQWQRSQEKSTPAQADNG